MGFFFTVVSSRSLGSRVQEHGGSVCQEGDLLVNDGMIATVKCDELRDYVLSRDWLAALSRGPRRVRDHRGDRERRRDGCVSSPSTSARGKMGRPLSSER